MGPPLSLWIKKTKYEKDRYYRTKAGENYESVSLPMVTEISQRVKELIKAPYHGNHIDEMKEK